MPYSSTDAVAPAPDALAPASKTSRYLNAKGINIVLAAFVVAVLAIKFGGEPYRRAQFRGFGTVCVEGMTFHLDPTDKVITQMIVQFGAWEPVETSYVRKILKPGDTFIDVGANIGWYTIVGSKCVGPEGRVIAFEPAPDSARLLSANIRDNGCARNTVLESKALSDKPGTLRLFLHDSNKGHHSIIKEEGHHFSVDVPAVTLDDYLGKNPGKIALIKLDTEGAESFILQGMKETLARQPEMPLLMEFYPELIRKAGFEPLAMLRRFHDAGYEIRPLGTGGDPPRPVPGDKLAAFAADLEHQKSYDNLLIRRP